MAVEDEIKEFKQEHPHPDQDGRTSLFRFSRPTIPRDYLAHLFVDGKLHHALPSQFNDPFECRPHFQWPKKSEDIQRIRKYLIDVARREGSSRKDAQAMIAKSMAKKGFMREIIANSISKTLNKVRVCSFTSSKENLLFWAHYADSHRGFCVEYDATQLPISYAFKIHYSNEYPEVIYPAPSDATGLRPVLIKSKEWEYEDEFRTLLVPGVTRQLRNDGTSLILSGSEISDIYFGAFMKDEHKQLLLQLLAQGPFDPRVWEAKLSESAFKLHFELINNSSA